MISKEKHLITASVVASCRSLSGWLCVMAAIVPSSFGVLITLRPPEAVEGLIAVPIHIAPEEGDQMAGLQFDLDYDGASMYIAGIEAGISAEQAAKDIVFSPMDENTIRVVVAGINQNTLEEGVVAMVYVQHLDDGAAGPAMELDAIVVSDPIGNAIESSYENLTVEEVADEESQSSDLVSDSASERISSNQPQAGSAGKSMESSVRRSEGNRLPDAETEKRIERAHAAEDSVVKGSSMPVPGNYTSRIRVQAAGERVKQTVSVSSAARQRRYQAEHGPAVSISGAGRIDAPDKAAVASGETTARTGSRTMNTVAMLTPLENMKSGVARQGAVAGTVKPRSTSGTHIPDSVWFLVSAAVILAAMAAQRLLIGGARKSRNVKVR